ncbi:MAG TPA: hypothetical protein VJQ77_02770 [Novosphingobium sp.]|nr:hypothetical protein [Novosphingobium sp.]
MLGPGIRNVFKSRWHALFWAGGVLLTAYCSVPSPDENAQGTSRAQVSQPDAHRNPWARDSVK